MGYRTLLLGKLVLFLAISCSTQSAQAATIFSLRSQFEAVLGSIVIDDYSDPGYSGIMTDAFISGVVGETIYQSTGFPNFHQIPNEYYCSGCNGSVLFTFTSTSVSAGGSVFGVGFELVGFENTKGNTAFVTFGDATTANFALPDASPTTGDLFWGITDPLGIVSIHIGLPDGGIVSDNSIQRLALDNLTVGTAPSPATALLLGPVFAVLFRFRAFSAQGAPIS